MLTLADMRFYRAAFIEGAAPGAWRFPLDEDDLSGLPPTVLLPADMDTLRDDCTALATRMERVGRAVLLLSGRGLVHGALRTLDQAAAMAEPFGTLCGFVARHLRA